MALNQTLHADHPIFQIGRRLHIQEVFQPRRSFDALHHDVRLGTGNLLRRHRRAKE